jgi:hypothetical protein
MNYSPAMKQGDFGVTMGIDSNDRILCNSSELKTDEYNLKIPVLLRECNGDASESALLKFVQLNFCDVNYYRAQIEKYTKFHIIIQINIKYQFMRQMIVTFVIC